MLYVAVVEAQWDFCLQWDSIHRRRRLLIGS